MFSEKVAVGSAWAWALLPNVIFWCTRYVWETSLSALLVAMIFWLTLELQHREGWLLLDRIRIALGHCGARAVPRCCRFCQPRDCGCGTADEEWQASHRRCCPRFRSLLRLHHAVDRFAIMRSSANSFSFATISELSFVWAMDTGADGTLMLYLDPTHDVYAMRQYQSMGELPCIALRKQQALDYIRADYHTICRALLEALVCFWAGPPKATEPGGWVRPRTLVPGLVDSDVLGIGPRAALAAARRVASILAESRLSSVYYCRVFDPALSPSHRTGDRNPVRLPVSEARRKPAGTPAEQPA